MTRKFGVIVLVAFGLAVGYLVLGVARPVSYAITPSPGAGTALTLSEIFACQQSSPNDLEWVEIYNSSASEIDLTAWKIGKNKSGTASLSGTLAGNSYKKILFSPGFANDGFAVTLTEPNATEPIESFPLAYKSDKTTLEKCPSTDTLTSWVKDGENWKLTTTLTPDGTNTHTAVSTPTPSPTSSPSATPTPTPSPTPTASPTLTPSPTPGKQPTGISLSEVYACQADSTREWVELHNTTTTALTLTNWKLTDDDNNDQSVASLQIPAKGYAVIEITKYARGMLTNDGDVVNLYDGVGLKVDSFAYTSCDASQSWAKVDSQWMQTSALTKGAAHTSAPPSPSVASAADETIATSTPATVAAGEILGTQDEPTASPTQDLDTAVPQATTATFSLVTVVSLVSILLGGGILTSLAIYLWWKPFIQPYLRRFVQKGV